MRRRIRGRAFALVAWTCACGGESISEEPDTTPTISVPCGNGRIDGYESCDDGNRSAGDGCDQYCGEDFEWECRGEPSTCRPTTCGDGTVEGAESCDDGNLNNFDGCGSSCKAELQCENGVCLAICGDAAVVEPETCDDGNVRNRDGCDETCRVETGFVCDLSLLPTRCDGECGDGILVHGEHCDDGNRDDDDGCPRNCIVP